MAEEKTPQEIAEAAKAKEEAKAAREKFLKEVRDAVNSVATDPNVRIILRYVMRLSGYEVNPVTLGVNGDVTVSSTIYNVGRESLYHDLRKTMSAETKNIVERSE